MSLTGCERFFNEDCDFEEYSEEMWVYYDWRLAESVPYENKPYELCITEETGSRSIIHTNSVGEQLKLESGEYNLIVYDEVKNITFSNNGYVISQNGVTNNVITLEPEHFYVGEKNVLIRDHKIQNGQDVLMLPQTRDLVIRIKFTNINDHKIKTVSGFKSLLNNVTVSRDISEGFIPQEVEGREVAAQVYANLNLIFEKIESTSRASVPIQNIEEVLFQSHNTLIGLGKEAKSLKLEYFLEDQDGIQKPMFLEIDVTSYLESFQTTLDRYHVFVLNLEINANSPTEEQLWSIKDWSIGNVTDVISTEN